jgi:hypothetical protein
LAKKIKEDIMSVDYIDEYTTFANYVLRVCNSKRVAKEKYGTTRVYKLDDIDIRCTIPGCKFTVTDKQGNVELDMNCARDGVLGVDDKVQELRFILMMQFICTIDAFISEKEIIAKREHQARMAEQARLAKAACKEDVAVKAARPDFEGKTKKLAAARGVIVEATKPQKGL